MGLKNEFKNEEKIEEKKEEKIEEKVFNTFFNLFYTEIGNRLNVMDRKGAEVMSIETIGQLTGDIFMGECFLVKVKYKIKEGFNDNDVVKSVRDLQSRDFS